MADGIDITRRDDGSKGAYRAVVDGHTAEMTYSRAGDSMIIIDHTDVPDALRGRSVGQALVRRAVEDARADGRSVIPLCPFAKAQFQRRAVNAEQSFAHRASPNSRKMRHAPSARSVPIHASRANRDTRPVARGAERG